MPEHLIFDYFTPQTETDETVAHLDTGRARELASRRVLLAGARSRLIRTHPGADDA